MRYDAVIIGAGPAGLAAAVQLRASGIDRVLVVDREDEPGGILLQCVHSGFGVQVFDEELTGPEYAERYVIMARDSGAELLMGACVVDVEDLGVEKVVRVLGTDAGFLEVRCRAVILAMGCRERNRGNINIPGERPAGVMTAGFAQKMVNIGGYLPGREVVILGSGDIGLIMARRLSWEGAVVRAVVEMQPYPGGLNRNVVQCLDDFSIPLYLSHTVTRIMGSGRVEAVEVSRINTRFEPRKRGQFTLPCDTLLLSVGLIPENELSRRVGVAIDSVTGGPRVDANLMTGVSGVFACGNVLHVHDAADYVSDEAVRCGTQAALYIRDELDTGRTVALRAGNLVRYVMPPAVLAGGESLVALRPMTPVEDVRLVVRSSRATYYRRRHTKVFPSSMVRIALPPIPPEESMLEVAFDYE